MSRPAIEDRRYKTVDGRVWEPTGEWRIAGKRDCWLDYLGRGVHSNMPGDSLFTDMQRGMCGQKAGDSTVRERIILREVVRQPGLPDWIDLTKDYFGHYFTGEYQTPGVGVLIANWNNREMFDMNGASAIIQTEWAFGIKCPILHPINPQGVPEPMTTSKIVYAEDMPYRITTCSGAFLGMATEAGAAEARRNGAEVEDTRKPAWKSGTLPGGLEWTEDPDYIMRAGDIVVLDPEWDWSAECNNIKGRSVFVVLAFHGSSIKNASWCQGDPGKSFRIIKTGKV